MSTCIDQLQRNTKCALIVLQQRDNRMIMMHCTSNSQLPLVVPLIVMWWLNLSDPHELSWMNFCHTIAHALDNHLITQLCSIESEKELKFVRQYYNKNNFIHFHFNRITSIVIHWAD